MTTPKLDNCKTQQPQKSTTPLLNDPKTQRPQNFSKPRVKGGQAVILTIFFLSDSLIYWYGQQNSCPALYGFQVVVGLKQGSSPCREQSPVEWWDFLSIHSSILPED